jgi:hypothetical protein
MRGCVDEQTVLQDDCCNEAKNKKSSDKNDDFLWY